MNRFTLDSGATAGARPRRSLQTLSALPLVMLALGTPLAPASQAQAQQAQGALEEIVVTARFREERLQDAPLAITAITADSLNLKGATNVVDVARWAPNTTIERLGPGWGPTLAANIRGIGLGDFKAVAEPGVPIYVDDVVLARPTGAIMDLLDLERVEILRGPQGTLFGKNAAGGVVRLITRRPTGDGPAFVEGTVGNYNRLDMRGSFESTVVPDSVFARFSFSAKRRDGHVDVLDFTCTMIQQGTPELAGLGDGIGGWDTETNTPIMVEPGSAEDMAFSLPAKTSPPGTGRGCLVDTMGDENMQSGRVALRWLASDVLEFNFTADAGRERTRGPADTMLDINPDLGLVGLFNNAVALPNWGVPFDRRFVTGDPYTIYSTFEDPFSGIETPNVTELDNYGFSGTMEWALTDDLNATFIVSYRKFDAFFGRDSDGSPHPINHTLDRYTSWQRTYEARLSGMAFGGMTEWTVGGFHLNASDVNPNISVLYPGVLPQGVIDRLDEQESENTGAFVHTVNRLTEDWTLTAGLRYTRDEKDLVQTRRFRPSGDLQFPITPSSLTTTKWTPSVSLQYRLTDDMQSYATYSRGFRGGGFNPRPANAAQVGAFDAETVDSYEVGLKADFFDNRLRMNTALFFMVYKNLQLPTVFVDEDGSVTFPPRNAGKAHIPGVEIDLQASPIDGLVFDASLGYNGFEFQDLGAADPEVIAEAGGNPASSPCIECRPARTPEWTGSLGAQYTLPADVLDGRVSLRGDLAYQSRVDYAVNNLDRAAQGGYTVANARISWASLDEDWSIAVFGTNLTNKRYLHSVLDFHDSLGGIQGSFARPREWGVTVRRTF